MRLLTHTGKLVDLEHPTPELVDVRDVAHALSMTCRYGGHCPRFYSVDEHSVHVLHYAMRRFGRRRSPTQYLAYLLHDASEAYLGDVVRPLKAILPDYRRLEATWESAIREKFGISDSGDLRDEVSAADLEVYREERFELFGPETEDPPREDSWTAAGVPMVECWSPERAEREFLFQYRVLSSQALRGGHDHAK